MEGRGKEVLAVAVLFFVLTWLTVSLRIYVRGFMLQAWGKDDTAMFVTLVWMSMNERVSMQILKFLAHIHNIRRMPNRSSRVWNWATSVGAS